MAIHNKTNISASIFNGSLLIVLGIIAIIRPAATAELLVLYFGAAVGLRSLFLLYSGFKAPKSPRIKIWVLFNAAMDMMFALVLWAHPKITLEILPVLMGIWAILSGLLEAAVAVVQRYENIWPKFLFSTVILIFGWVVLLHPLVAGNMLSSLFGALLICIGLGYITISISLRKLFSQ